MYLCVCIYNFKNFYSLIKPGAYFIIKHFNGNMGQDRLNTDSVTTFYERFTRYIYFLFLLFVQYWLSGGILFWWAYGDFISSLAYTINKNHILVFLEGRGSTKLLYLKERYLQRNISGWFGTTYRKSKGNCNMHVLLWWQGSQPRGYGKPA